jgi:hypothetical protein
MAKGHLSGTTGGTSKVTGRLRGFRITESIMYNRKVIILTSILTLISIVIGIFVPYVLIVAGISIIVMLVTTFVFPPAKETIIEKKEV